MLPSFILALREGLEAALVIGIILGATQKIGRSDLRPSLWKGVAAASLLSLATGIGLNLIGTEFEGQGETIFEGLTMLVAAALLTWMIFWMGRQNRHLKERVETGIRQAQPGRSALAVFFLAFFAVLREGVELAFFLFAARLESNAAQTIGGASLGLVTAVGLGWLLFSSTRRLNLRQFFNVTNILLTFFAAGLVAHAAHEFISAGVLPVGIAQVWNLSGLLRDTSPVGMVASSLFGYSSQPSLTEVISYLAYFVALFFALWLPAHIGASRQESA